MYNPYELVAYEVIGECPDGGAPYLLDAGSATRAEVAEQRAQVPPDAAVEIHVYTLH